MITGPPGYDDKTDKNIGLKILKFMAIEFPVNL